MVVITRNGPAWPPVVTGTSPVPPQAIARSQANEIRAPVVPCRIITAIYEPKCLVVWQKNGSLFSLWALDFPPKFDINAAMLGPAQKVFDMLSHLIYLTEILYQLTAKKET